MAKCKNCGKEIKVNSDEIFCSAKCASEFFTREHKEGLSW